MRRGTGPQSRAAPERRCHQADWRCARCARAWPLRAGQLMRGPSDGGRSEGSHAVSFCWEPGRRIRGARSDDCVDKISHICSQSVDKGLGVSAKSSPLFDSEGSKAIVRVGREYVVSVIRDLRRCRFRRCCTIHNCGIRHVRLNKTLPRAGSPSEFKEWTELAQNRELWRARVYGLAEYPTPPPVRASS